MRKLFILIIFSCYALIVDAQQSGIKVMTFNIRYDNPNDGDYSWKKMINTHPTICRSAQN